MAPFLHRGDESRSNPTKRNQPPHPPKGDKLKDITGRQQAAAGMGEERGPAGQGRAFAVHGRSPCRARRRAESKGSLQTPNPQPAALVTPPPQNKGIYGPRTVYLIAIAGYPGTHEFLLMDDGKWMHVKETTHIGGL